MAPNSRQFHASVLVTFILIAAASLARSGPVRADQVTDPSVAVDSGPGFSGMPPSFARPQVRSANPSDAFLPEANLPASRQRPADAQPATPPTAAERAEAIRKALAPRPPVASVRRQTLDTLYGKLAAAQDEQEAKGLASLISDVWMRSESDTANLVMQRAMMSLEAKNYPLALQLLDRLVILQPNWPEAWNKRASTRFFAGDLDGAMADVDHVLKLEPRHFGALEGMAAILRKTGFDKRALEVYRRALAIYPHQTELEKLVDKLTLEVEGQGI